ncbi:MAG TPA: Uma2 family endonuclease [Chroococcidiopsis sp.]
MTTLELQQLTIPPGQTLLISGVDWQTFEAILIELGEPHTARIAYDNGILEIITPLPEHEAVKEILSDLLKALLEELDIEFLTLGSTTFKHPDTLKGIEPDQCFYIQNEAAVRGKDRLDLRFDPPPDLAIEIDITSRTHPNTYAALGVPELWRRNQNQLQFNRLIDGHYQEVPESPTFPGLPLQDLLPQYITQSRIQGRNQTLKAFRTWVRAQL